MNICHTNQVLSQGATFTEPNEVTDEVKALGFQICAVELGSMVEHRDLEKLKLHGGVAGVAEKLTTSINHGITTDTDSLTSRQKIYGINEFKETKSFRIFVGKTLQNETIVILKLYALVSLTVGLANEGWPEGIFHGLRIAAVIVVFVFVTATTDYRQSLKDLEMEKKKSVILVTRNGSWEIVCGNDILTGDIVHLRVGNQVPADGLFVSGSFTLIDESSLSGETEPVAVRVSYENPFLLCGTKVQEGACKMMVTTVGMRTQWGKLVASLGEGGRSDDETPIQLKLNRVATIIGKICLLTEIVSFTISVQGLVSRKMQEGTLWRWSGDDAVELLEIFVVAVTGRSNSGNQELKSFIRSQVCKYAFFPH